MLFRPFIAAVFGLTLTSSVVLAGWLEDTETDRLRAELGAAAPTGAGVKVLQSEALDGGYYPQAGGPSSFAGVNSGAGRDFTGTTFLPQSGAQAYSAHANIVAIRFYEKASGIAPGISEVSLYTANDYINWLPTSSGTPGRVHNSSWIGSGGQGNLDNADAAALSDGFVHCAGLNNSKDTALPALFAHAYNLLVVGRKDGEHSRGVTSSSYTGAGRMKPDIVGSSDATSFTTPEVSAAAALLLETIDKDASLAAANDPNVIRAILLAGATKDFTASWKRVNQSKPYDTIYGAGLVNTYRSYHILKGGAQSPSETVPSGLKGWAKLSSNGTRKFLIEVPDGQFAEEFSIVLSWFRAPRTSRFGITLDSGIGNRPELTLILYRREIGGALTEIDRSESPVDNVEHVFRRHLGSGEYIIEVPALSNTYDYSLAWNVELGDGPNLLSQTKGVVQFSDLDPAASYNVRRSTSLVSTDWQTVGTLPAGARFTASFTDPSPPSERAFYRIEWTDPPTPQVPPAP